MKLYQLPKHIDLYYFSNLVLEIKNNNFASVILDWKMCEYIDIKNYCHILHLRALFDDASKIKHLSLNNYVYREISFIFEYDLENKSDNFSSIFISPIFSEEHLLQDSKIFNNFYSASIGEGYDISSLRIIFSELYMNICQHSEVSKGYIFVSEPDNEGNYEIIFSDKGVGIVRKVREYYQSENFSTDADVIRYATQEGKTTQSILQNQGKGLANLVSQVGSLKADLQIYSSKGVYKKIGEAAPSLEDNIHEYEGTLIYLRFNIANIPLYLEDDNEVGEL